LDDTIADVGVFVAGSEWRTTSRECLISRCLARRREESETLKTRAGRSDRESISLSGFKEASERNSISSAIFTMIETQNLRHWSIVLCLSLSLTLSRKRYHRDRDAIREKVERSSIGNNEFEYSTGAGHLFGSFSFAKRVSALWALRPLNPLLCCSNERPRSAGGRNRDAEKRVLLAKKSALPAVLGHLDEYWRTDRNRGFALLWTTRITAVLSIHLFSFSRLHISVKSHTMHDTRVSLILI